MMRISFLSFIFFTTYSLSVFAGDDDDKGYTIDQISAVIGSDIVLLSEIHEQAAVALKELQKAASQGGANLLADRRKTKILEETLEQIIDNTLVEREARELKLSVTTEEINRAIANMARDNGVDEETFRTAIKAQGMDFLTYRNSLRDQILRYKVLNLKVRGRVKISEAEARQYYNDQVRDVRATGSFEGAHILVRVVANARATDVAKARKRAEEILARLKSEAEFSAIAREESDDKATSANGGSLGVRHPGEIPNVLNRAFLDLEVGEIAGPIQTTSGFHIIRLNDRQALGVQPFAEVKDKITAQLAQDEMIRQEKIWLKELRLRTFIDVRL
ncbi:MAG: hypothetical protein GY847_30090 [Proteobacteria bacterium]|nr:hypothetical protein [Pseudomonadota bacterium]